MMTTDTTVLEQELRELFAAIPPPPAPASWRRDEPAAGALRTPKRQWVARRVAVAAAMAAAVSAVFVLVHRDTPVSAISVSVLASGGELSCSLPISALSRDRTTGFIVFDHGHATFQPVHTNGTTYVAGLSRWVDVLPQRVAPDGRSYVSQDFSGGQTIIHVVDATGDRIVLKTGAPVNVIGFSRQGILLSDLSAGAQGPPTTFNMELLDPASGAVRPFPYPPPQFGAGREVGGSEEAGYRQSDNTIWLTAYSPATDSTLVRRYDLATGVTTEWFDGRTDGHGHVEVVGTDAKGLPIVQLASSDLFHTNPAHRAGIVVRTILLTAPHVASVLNQGRVGDSGVAGNLAPLSVTDGDGVWLAADDGTIWMYRPTSGLQEMARVVKTSTEGPPGVAISGPCR